MQWATILIVVFFVFFAAGLIASDFIPGKGSRGT